MLPFLLIHRDTEFSYFGDNTITWKSQGGYAKILSFKTEENGASKLPQQGKAFAAKPDDLTSIPKTHILEENNQLPKVVL